MEERKDEVAEAEGVEAPDGAGEEGLVGRERGGWGWRR